MSSKLIFKGLEKVLEENFWWTCRDRKACCNVPLLYRRAIYPKPFHFQNCHIFIRCWPVSSKDIKEFVGLITLWLLLKMLELLGSWTTENGREKRVFLLANFLSDNRMNGRMDALTDASYWLSHTRETNHAGIVAGYR